MSQDTIADSVELIGTVVILWLGIEMVLRNQISIGELITFYALLAYFTSPIKNLIELQPTIQTAIVAADRLSDILPSLRGSVAYVDQNVFLFSDTIKNNLRLGNPNATDDEIYRACEVSKSDEFIKSLPLGYDTPIDENGSNLSGGQRQRLAIARARLKHPQLLILDEATSNLDTITEAGIKNTIFNLAKSVSCIIIAHRLTTVKNCDRIYVMESGRIVESGTHDELINKGGEYTRLWNMQ